MDYTKKQLEIILNNLMQHSDKAVRAAVAEQGYGPAIENVPVSELSCYAHYFEKIRPSYRPKWRRRLEFVESCLKGYDITTIHDLVYANLDKFDKSDVIMNADCQFLKDFAQTHLDDIVRNYKEYENKKNTDVEFHNKTDFEIEYARKRENLVIPALERETKTFNDFERKPPRKMAVDELAFQELELYADGYKGTEISKLVGRPFIAERVEVTFFRIVNFGYEGIIPPNITPKYSPEVLCQKINDRADFSEVAFTRHSSITKQEFLSENFLCGCGNSNELISLDSDVRRLDLSVGAFNPLMRGFNNTKSAYYFCRPVEVPFTIRNLVEMTEQDLLRIRQLGKDGVAEIKEELAKHGFEISKKPSFESLVQAAETKAALQSPNPNTPGKEPEPEH